MKNHPPLLLVGCGKMGGALANRWLRDGAVHARQITIITPAGAAGIPAELSHVQCYKTLNALPRGYHAGIIVFAVKPQMLPELLPLYAKRFAKHHPLLLSVAAGTPTKIFTSYFGADAAVIRAMPNTPALIGKGITVAHANPQVPDSAKLYAAELLRAVGDLLWVEEESWIDSATAISGSGPAYVFHFIEALAKSGKALGLPADVSRYLALLTARGAAELALLSGLPLSTLREQVTSKGGTTEAALKILMNKTSGLEPLLLKSARAAHARAKQLAKKK